jgi:hypothetical protein
MNLQEKVKTIWKAAAYEETRVVCSKKQTFEHGRPAPEPSAAPPSTESETLQINRRRRSEQAENHHGSSFFQRVGSRVQSGDNLLSLGLFRSGTRTGEDSNPGSGRASASASSPVCPSPSAASSHTSPPNSPIRSRSNSSTSDENASEDVEMIMQMRIPTDTTPSHNVAPVFVSHRIKWSVLNVHAR